MEQGVASDEVKDVGATCTQKKLECGIFSLFYHDLFEDEDRLRLFLQ